MEDRPQERPSNDPGDAFTTFIPDAVQRLGAQGMRASRFGILKFVRHDAGLSGSYYCWRELASLSSEESRKAPYNREVEVKGWGPEVARAATASRSLDKEFWSIH